MRSKWNIPTRALADCINFDASMHGDIGFVLMEGRQRGKHVTNARLEELPQIQLQAGPVNNSSLLFHLILLQGNPITAFKSEAGRRKLHIHTHRLECSFQEIIREGLQQQVQQSNQLPLAP